MCEAGIVVVTYDSEAEIGTCLDRALTTGAEIVVVDNASTDRTCDEVTRRGVRLITNPQNRGFAAAVNQGIRSLETPFVLLLNPDARLETSIEALVECCRRPGVAGAGGKLVDAAGLPQAGFAVRNLPTAAALIFEALLVNRIWPGNPVNWHYRCLGFDFSTPGDVEQPAGAFLAIRRDVWQELNGFDERFYPLWFEDVDFCWRARQRGYRMSYTPDAVAKHTGGHSVAKISLENRQLYWYRSLLGYAVGHYRSSTARMVCAAVFLGSIPRMLLGVAAFRSLTPIAVYGKVMALAGRTFIRPAG
ncbi:MAG TPA: glycosyltransferase family 2 protein [Bryobacteraceae bacterium]|nr:glycosyltransferase family 2 protein [Bryobacteraceae bacterium]